MDETFFGLAGDTTFFGESTLRRTGEADRLPDEVRLAGKKPFAKGGLWAGEMALCLGEMALRLVKMALRLGEPKLLGLLDRLLFLASVFL